VVHYAQGTVSVKNKPDTIKCNVKNILITNSHKSSSKSRLIIIMIIRIIRLMIIIGIIIIIRRRIIIIIIIIREKIKEGQVIKVKKNNEI
jgi:hypothetical protein